MGWGPNASQLLKNITYPASNNVLIMSKMVRDSELTLGLANNVKYINQ